MISPLDMFQIGIGSSSSHTVGPMKIALKFVQDLQQQDLLQKVKKIKVELFGSLALTGEGHGTLYAIVSGLSGKNPQQIQTHDFLHLYHEALKTKQIKLLGEYAIDFDPLVDIILEKNIFLKEHANATRLTAFTSNDDVLYTQDYFSIGGGFIVAKGENEHNSGNYDVPFKFTTAHELLELAQQHHLSIAEIVIQNETSYQKVEEVQNKVLAIVEAMSQSIMAGISSQEIILPGGINLKRRSPELYKKLTQDKKELCIANQRMLAMAFAMAVNEENAAFGKIVTAPTNGSAGTIAGVLEYYKWFNPDATPDKIIDFILTAGAIGTLYKIGASISAAEVGCQGEIGVSCSMASGALTAVLGGNVKQVLRAAEIAMEHSLGMTCDPINGLVQVPCIERNGVAATRAIDIAHMSLLESGDGLISLDGIIKTMMATGRDMNSKYKETALGGLAVSHVHC